MTKPYSRKASRPAIEIVSVAGAHADYFKATVTHGDVVVAEITSTYQFMAIRRAKRALKLYKKHSIRVSN